MSRFFICFTLWALSNCGSGFAGEKPLTPKEAVAALRKAVDFFRLEVAAGGGYLWQYSEDLSRREGERRVNEHTAWVQPPGTPTVGAAFLKAYQLTNDPYYLEAARETAMSLVNTQLESGGWDYAIVFSPNARKQYRYRVDKDRPKARNVTTLDDNTTQAAVRFLIDVDQALDSQDEQISACVQYALDRLLAAQYPNGAWPQRFSEAPDSEQFPVIKANYPDKWSRTHPGQDYRSYYTLNDNTQADMIGTMLYAADAYDDDRFRRSAKLGGDFLLLAQMPEPQPAWAQQYNARMQPAWARRFEPPSITGGESQGALRVLMDLYKQTGDEKYLKPIPAAVDYLKRSRLPDGRVARFYELRTNRPLYFTKEYELTYDDGDLPTHYSFKNGSSLDHIQSEYERLTSTEYVSPVKPSPRVPKMTDELAAAATTVVAEMDPRGAWVTRGRLKTYDDGQENVIECRTFVKNVEILARFIAASN